MRNVLMKSSLFVEQCIRKRTCQLCAHDIPSGKYCLCYYEEPTYPLPHWYKKTKKSICLDCGDKLMKITITDLVKIKEQIRYRKRRSRKIAEILSKNQKIR